MLRAAFDAQLVKIWLSGITNKGNMRFDAKGLDPDCCTQNPQKLV